VHWWSQQACDAAAEAQAADPSPQNLMAAAQVQALISMAEALHRIAAALEGEPEGASQPGPLPARPVRVVRGHESAPGRHAPARPN